MKAICSNCAKGINRRPSVIKSVKIGVFCSKGCFDKYRQGRPNPNRKTGRYIKCLGCNKNFYAKKSDLRRRRVYCSKKCFYKSIKTYQKCSHCHKTFYNRGNKKNVKYCSRKCAQFGRRKGIVFQCEWCENKIYKSKSLIEKHNFCGRKCANKYQARNKSKFICKICGKTFGLSKSLAENRKYEIKYCSMKCRNNDKEQRLFAAIRGNLAQLNKKGLNKLELAGQKILNDIGVSFNEQVLMFNKFLVDVLIPSRNLIIQWDGVYWHNNPRRKKLDKSQDAYLKQCGYHVLRITDLDIKNNKDKVYRHIKEAIQ